MRPFYGCKIHKTALLTPCEIKIIRLIAEGFSSKEIAVKCGVSLDTIESHRTHIFGKLGVRSAVELVRYAIRYGLAEI